MASEDEYHPSKVHKECMDGSEGQDNKEWRRVHSGLPMSGNGVSGTGLNE